MTPHLPGVRRLSALIGTSDSRAALVAGAQIYVNFLSLTRASGWAQGYAWKMHQQEQSSSAKELSPTSAHTNHPPPPPPSFPNVDSAVSTTTPLESRQGLLTAGERYLSFMTIRGDMPRAVPTRDISVVWCADLLRPQGPVVPVIEETEESAGPWYCHQQHRLLQSGAQLEKVLEPKYSPNVALAGGLAAGALAGSVGGLGFGGIAFMWGGAKLYCADTPGAKTVPEIQRFDRDGSGVVTVDERSQYLEQWGRVYHDTAKRWKESFEGPYRLPPGKMPGVWPRGQPGEKSVLLEQANRLADGVTAQSGFARRILAMGPRVIDAEWIDRAVTRYAQFLKLARENPGQLLVPTLDIDLVWHAHMLSPLDYREDCHNMVGRLLSHNDRVDEGKLSDSFNTTQDLWHAAYGSQLVWRSDDDRKRQYAVCATALGYHGGLHHSGTASGVSDTNDDNQTQGPGDWAHHHIGGDSEFGPDVSNDNSGFTWASDPSGGHVNDGEGGGDDGGGADCGGGDCGGCGGGD